MTSVAPETAKVQYEQDGFYLQATSLIPQGLVDLAAAGMDAIRRGEYDTDRAPEASPWNPGDDPNVLCKIEQPQFASKAVMEIVSHAALGELAAAITGASLVQVWWVQLLHKPADRGNPHDRTSVGWHKDRAYWGAWEEGSELFTAWVALSDVREECGAMRFLRGSHRWECGLQSDFFEQNLDGQRKALSLPEGAAWDEVPAVLPPGGVSFHHCLTYHGSGPNRCELPRRSLAIHLRTQNSRPVEDRREGLTRYLDDPHSCPVIYR